MLTLYFVVDPNQSAIDNAGCQAKRWFVRVTKICSMLFGVSLKLLMSNKLFSYTSE